jgi:pyruvate dehydrogenase E2 component (dihydrolipoamide acetyltransferase)
MPLSRSSAAIVPFDSPSVSFEERRPTTMRSITAERLTFSKQTIPHFYLTIECDADPLLAAKKAVNDHGSNRLTLTDFVVRASALALVKVPAANSAWVDGSVRVYSSCDIAVAVNTPAGLIAPVVRDAQTKGVVTISRELKELAERARNGQLSKQDYTGGTFTISNLGMFGVSSLYAIVNPPQSCILGIGKVQRLPVVRDEQIVIGDIMTCTLSADHRALDGVIGAELLSEFRRYIEDPWLMVF